MKKINIIEFLKTYLLTLILIVAAFICSNNAVVRENESGGIDKVTVINSSKTDFEPYY